MMNMVTRLFARSEPVVSEAGPRDSAAITAVHAVSFQRGWSEDEFERLLTDRSVIAHRTTNGRTLTGFILSRMAAGEAEILSVAVAPARRGKGLFGHQETQLVRTWAAALVRSEVQLKAGAASSLMIP
jgi:ribosomal-protein-alanine N-acetyltransferase